MTADQSGRVSSPEDRHERQIAAASGDGIVLAARDVDAYYACRVCHAMVADIFRDEHEGWHADA